jgi:hypothetical protein
MHLFYHFYDLERHEELTRNPDIGRSIKSIYYSSDRNFCACRKMLSKRKFQHQIQLFMSTASPEQTQFDICYERYQNAFAKQKAMFQQDTDLKIIQKMVNQLPNLEKVIVNRSLKSPLEREKQDRRGSLRQTEGGRLLEPIPREDDDEIPSRQLLSILSAANEAGIKLKELGAGTINAKIFDHVEMFGAFCSTLTSLTMKVYILRKPIGVKGKHQDNIANGTMKKILKNMRHLRVLNLSFSVGWAGRTFNDGLIDLDSVFDTEYKWPLLEDLTIGNLKSTEDELVMVLYNHQDTLKALHIDSYTLRPGRWKSCFTRIQETLTLQNVGLSGTLWATAPGFPQRYSQTYDLLRHSQPISSVERFLLHGGEFPQNVLLSSNSVDMYRSSLGFFR